MSIEVQVIGKQTLWLSQTAINSGIGLDHFSPEYLQQQQLVSRTATGRGTVYFFSPPKSQLTMVLRAYLRGGLVAKFNRNIFWFSGTKNIRCAKELAILQHLQQHHVNVPKPIAAMASKHLLGYSASIITGAIENAQELHSMLTLHSVDNSVWAKVGQEIKKMHNAGVCHDDINVKNVLIDKQQQVHLLDFDKCDITPDTHWQSANLARFKRSIDKQVSMQKKAGKDYFVDSAHWQALVDGYEQYKA